jgi:hypothetical protein
MSVLERYSDQDCTVLLGHSRQDVREARMRALQHVAESDRISTVAGSGAATPLTELPLRNAGGVLFMIAGILRFIAA